MTHSNEPYTVGRVDLSNAAGRLSEENAALRAQLRDAQTRLQAIKADAADAARFRAVALRFDDMNASSARTFLDALGIKADVGESLEDIIDRAGAGRA